MTIKIGWGWKVGLLYSSFVAMMIVLVIASSRQEFDLVSKDYYKDEISYQQVLDANRNQAGLSGTLTISVNDATVKIVFPAEFAGKPISGKIFFYSIVQNDWDKTFPIVATDNAVVIDRTLLQHANYKVKINYTVDDKDYYLENDLNLSR